MDWSRVKTIFISVLLVIDLCLGGLYFYTVKGEELRSGKAIENAISYAESEGLKVQTELPSARPKMQPLSVRLEPGTGGEAITEYEKTPILITGAENISVLLEDDSVARRKIDSSSKALMKLLGSLSAEEKEAGVTVSSIDIVYWVELSGEVAAGQKDTAIPSWRIVADGREYIFRAYTE